MESILEIKNLKKNYRNFRLEDISFCIPYGYICGLIGPNGAGKTTIIKSIMNLIPRDGGSIDVFGLDNRINEVEIKERTGFVYENPDFYNDSKLKLIKKIISPFYKKWDEEKFENFIVQFGLDLNQRAKTLSQGMKMKFWLAVALSHNAELILLDEPTAGLDPVFRREFLEILTGIIQDEKKSVLFSTHITSDLERIADYITFIFNGRLVFSKPLYDISEEWGVIKGGNELLKPEYNGLIKGYKKTSLGVEALTSDRKTAEAAFGRTAVFEKAGLDDILFYISREGKNV
jgi:ABC-2 type transport system ATP-binding protein